MEGTRDRQTQEGSRERDVRVGGSNFTAWLQGNLDVLNEAVGIQLSGVQDGETPSSAEIVARDPSGGAVIIENEPSESGDAGLGKLLTSLASVRATTGVWIVADARPEHLAAVSWINEMSQAALYLPKVEAFRIDDSPPAPIMTLVSGPPSGDAIAPPAVATGSSLDTPFLPLEEAAIPGPIQINDRTADAMMDEAGGAPPVMSPAAEAIPVEALVEAGTGGITVQAPPVGRDTTGLVLYQFWTELLEKAGERTRLRADVEPIREKAVSAGTGVAGLSYRYFVDEHEAGVELFVHRGEDRRT